MDLDIDDAQAQAFQEALIQQGLPTARANDLTHRLPFTGLCHNCADPLPEHGRRFCDPYCHEDWEKRQRATRNRSK